MEDYVLLEKNEKKEKRLVRTKKRSSWPRLSTISSKTQKKHLFPRPEKLGPYEKHIIDPNKCPMTEALRKKEHSHYRMRLENLFFKTSGLGDKHRREEFPKYGIRYHNNANSLCV